MIVNIESLDEICTFKCDLSAWIDKDAAHIAECVLAEFLYSLEEDEVFILHMYLRDLAKGLIDGDDYVFEDLNAAESAAFNKAIPKNFTINQGFCNVVAA